MGKIAFVFAGQGAQHPGMGQELAKISPAAAEVFQKLDALRPLNVGQAGRISGVSPADVAALMIWLQAHDKEDRDNG